MIKKVFKPFWSLDVIETENWLSEMSIKGWHIKGIDILTRMFIFEKDENRIVTFRICYQKAATIAPSQSLVNNGWYQVFSKGKWSILANDNDLSLIKTHPARDGLLKRSRTIRYFIGTPLFIYLVSYLPMISIILMDIPKEVMDIYKPGIDISKPGIIRPLIIVFLIFIIVKLIKSDENIRMEKGTDLNLTLTIPVNTILDNETESDLKKSGKIIKKTRLLWCIAPDRIEEWLENMESRGYHLYRLSELGNSFFFMRGEPRKVKYFADFQSSPNDSYFEIHKANGWKLLFTSFLSWTKYTLWSKEYTEEKPELYSDGIHIIKHARNQCILNSIFYIPLIMVYIRLFILQEKFYFVDGTIPMFWLVLGLIIQSILLIEFGYFVVSSTGYYLRVRKKYSA